MKVHELIARLKEVDQNATVILQDCYDNECHTLKDFETRTVGTGQKLIVLFDVNWSPYKFVDVKDA